MKSEIFGQFDCKNTINRTSKSLLRPNGLPLETAPNPLKPETAPKPDLAKIKE